MKKIAICIPHNYPEFNRTFTLSLLSLLQSFHKWNKGNYDLDLFFQNVGWIDQMRNTLANDEVVNNYDYLLWLDTDMMFPADMIARMLKHFEKISDLEAVTGLYTYKVPPFMPHVYTKLNENGKFNVAGAFPLNELFVVEGAGFGCIMIKSSVFKRTKKPYFSFEMKKDGNIGIGEDLYFCKKAKMNMVCDPSIACLHLQECGFGISNYVQYNGLSIINGQIKASKDELEKIYQSHRTKA